MHGAVSSSVVQLMAQSTLKRFETNWAIAISGIAGPSGGNKQKPIGYVEFGIAGPKTITSFAEKFGSHQTRQEIQELSVVRALDTIRLLLQSNS